MNLNRYFYTVEMGAENQKVIHLEGNIHFNDANDTDHNYRLQEWALPLIPVTKAKQMLGETFLYYADEYVKSIKDCTEAEMNEIILSYFDGESGTELNLVDVSEETPVGNYWFDASTSKDAKLNTMDSMADGFKIERNGKIITLTPEEMSDFRYLDKALDGRACLNSYNCNNDSERAVIAKMQEDEEICYNIQSEVLDVLCQESGVEIDVIKEFIKKNI